MVQKFLDFRILMLASVFFAGAVFASTDSTAISALSDSSSQAQASDSVSGISDSASSLVQASQAPISATDSSDSSRGAPKASHPESPKHPVRIGFMYEMARLHSADLNYEMTREGKPYRIDVDVSDMVGIVGRYGLNQWISFFGILGYQKFDIGYTPKSKDSPGKRKNFSIRNVLLQLDAEVGYSFLELKKYQFRLLGFFGGTTGVSFIGDDYYMNTPLFGYTRGVALEINVHRVELLAGFRSSHIYFHTYKSNHRNEDDYSFMLDFDTMSSPFFSIGIGF